MILLFAKLDKKIGCDTPAAADKKPKVI